MATGERVRRMHGVAVMALVIGLLVTAGLTAAARVAYDNSQHHLTSLEARLTAAAVEVAPVDIERRLGRAVTAAAAGGGDAALFRSALSGSVGKGGPFAAAELFRLAGSRPSLMSAEGGAPIMPPGSPRQAAIVQAATATRSFAVAWLTSSAGLRLGYAVADRSPAGEYVAYAEQALPPTRRVTLPPSSPASDLDFALYFGRRPVVGDLLETNVAHLPLAGPTATVDVPFGNHALTLVVAPRGSLVGSFGRYLPWGIAAIGLVLSLAAALTAERLGRRRSAAEALARDNEALYRAQRDVAEALQRSLLPEVLPRRDDIVLDARYRPGTAGLDVGGDWYDVVEVDDRRVFFTIGDVAGHGLEAATLMGQLRHVINAFAVQGDDPHDVLTKVSTHSYFARDGRFATVICGVLDTVTGEVTLANAGHIPPVLIDADSCRPLLALSDPPVGVGGAYAAQRFRLPPDGTLLAVTDGLVERRGESLTAGIERLCAAAAAADTRDGLLDSVLETMVPGGNTDDIAMLSLRWAGGPEVS